VLFGAKVCSVYKPLGIPGEDASKTSLHSNNCKAKQHGK
jgi:hypothetical protein